MYRTISYLLFVLVVLMLNIMIFSSPKTEDSVAINESEPEYFTLEDLSQYDGNNEQPSYIAINGIVYDVTDVEEWHENPEKDTLTGKDLSENMNDYIIDHNLEEIILEKGTEIGILE